PASAAAEFTWRCQLLDRLDWHRAELSAVTVDGANAPIAALRDEVLASCLRLEQMNRDTAEVFRIRIATRRCIRGNLLDALQPYADSAPGERLRYDSLDVLIAGILGIDELTGNDDVLSDAEMVRYQPTPARIALELVRRTNPQPGDVFVDIGSGLGVVPIMVALLSGASALGIEVQATYCDHARAAARRLN